MGQAIGGNSRLVIDFETTFGADPATKAAMVVPINSWDVSAKRSLNTPATLTGRRSPVKPFAGNTQLTGNAVVPVDLIAFGWWLRAMFGAPTTTGTGPYTHVFKVPQQQPSLVAEKMFDFATSKTYMKQNGIKISTLGVTFGGDGELVANMGIVGAAESAASGVPYVASPTVVGFDRLNNFQATIAEGGSVLATVTECALNLNFALDASNYVIGGGGKLGSLPEGVIGVSGQLTALFTDTALITKAANLTESSLTLTLTSGAHSLEFEIPELLYDLSTPGITGPQGVRQQMGFQGYLDNDAASSAFVVTLINSQSTY